MRIGAADLVRLWEAGDGRPLLDKGLVLLGVAAPSVESDSLADLSIGERNRAILEFRTRLWGSAIVAEVKCPKCGDRLEMDFDLRAILSVSSTGERGRALTSRDLLAVAGLPPEKSRNLLIERLGVEAEGAELAEADPLAEIVIEPTCPSCGELWRVFLDPVQYVWSEVEVRVMRLVRDVHRLARAYGWSERDILSMSARKRQLYLRLVGAG